MPGSWLASNGTSGATWTRTMVRPGSRSTRMPSSGFSSAGRARFSGAAAGMRITTSPPSRTTSPGGTSSEVRMRTAARKSRVVTRTARTSGSAAAGVRGQGERGECVDGHPHGSSRRGAARRS